MAFMSAEQAAAAAASTVRMALLLELQFLSGTMYLWNGFGVRTFGGQAYQSVGVFGDIQNLSQTRQATSQKVTARLSGISPDVLALAMSETNEVQGQPAFIRAQLLDADWQAYGGPLLLFWGTMQRMTVVRSAADVTGRDGGRREIELEMENAFARRSMPSNGTYTDADQRARHAGDLFCRFVTKQDSQVVTWPDY